MTSYGFATILEPHQNAFAFAESSVPLHVTHVDSFNTDLKPAALLAKFQAVLMTQRSFMVQILEDDMIGPDKDIPVTRLELSPELMNFHSVIMDFLEQEGAVLKRPQIYRGGYEPHVSMYGSRRIAADSKVCIREVSVGSKTTDGQSCIIATIPLG